MRSYRSRFLQNISVQNSGLSLSLIKLGFIYKLTYIVAYDEKFIRFASRDRVATI